jgi:hypothetical protein
LHHDRHAVRRDEKRPPLVSPQDWEFLIAVGLPEADIPHLLFTFGTGALAPLGRQFPDIPRLFPESQEWIRLGGIVDTVHVCIDTTQSGALVEVEVGAGQPIRVMNGSVTRFAQCALVFDDRSLTREAVRDAVMTIDPLALASGPNYWTDRVGELCD